LAVVPASDYRITKFVQGGLIAGAWNCLLRGSEWWLLKAAALIYLSTQGPEKSSFTKIEKARGAFGNS
jgi:hypothetical protein